MPLWSAAPHPDAMHNTTEPVVSPAATPADSRKNPFLAELIGHDRLTSGGLSQGHPTFCFETRRERPHLHAGRFSVRSFGSNSPALVDELIALLEFDPNAR